jgi:hypothetical protein
MATIAAKFKKSHNGTENSGAEHKARVTRHGIMVYTIEPGKKIIESETTRSSLLPVAPHYGPLSTEEPPMGSVSWDRFCTLDPNYR